MTTNPAENTTRLQKHIADGRLDLSKFISRDPITVFGYCAVTAIGTALVTVFLCRTWIDWSAVQTIPGTVWAALLLGPLTFAGVLLTNRSHDRRAAAQLAADSDKSQMELLHDADRLAMQLDHAAVEAVKEREAEMRREVYLEAAAELVRANVHLGALFNFDFESKNAFDGVAAFAAANAKVLLVADEKTASEANKLATIHGKLILIAGPVAARASQKFAELRAAKKVTSAVVEEIDRLSSERDRVSGDIRQWEASNRITVELENANYQLARVQAKQAEAEDRALAAQRAYAMFIRPHLESIGRQQVKVLACLRQELGLAAEECSMQQEWEQMRQDINQQADEVFSVLGAGEIANQSIGDLSTEVQL